LLIFSGVNGYGRDTKEKHFQALCPQDHRSILHPHRRVSALFREKRDLLYDGLKDAFTLHKPGGALRFWADWQKDSRQG